MFLKEVYIVVVSALARLPIRGFHLRSTPAVCSCCPHFAPCKRIRNPANFGWSRGLESGNHSGLESGIHYGMESGIHYGMDSGIRKAGIRNPEAGMLNLGTHWTYTTCFSPLNSRVGKWERVAEDFSFVWMKNYFVRISGYQSLSMVFMAICDFRGVTYLKFSWYFGLKTSVIL